MRLDPHDRYIIHRRGIPVFTTSDVTDLITYLWGRHIRDRYVVYDYEHPYPVDTPDLLQWLEPLKAAAGLSDEEGSR